MLFLAADELLCFVLLVESKPIAELNTFYESDFLSVAISTFSINVLRKNLLSLVQLKFDFQSEFSVAIRRRRRTMRRSARQPT